MTKSFLLADGDRDFVALVKAALEDLAAPLVPTVCDDGDAVITRLKRTRRQPVDERPAFLIMAQQLPGYDGTELLLYLRTSPEWKALPIVVIGDEPEVSEVERAMKYGATAYFLKPASRDECRHVLGAILNRFGASELPTPFVPDSGIVERHFVGPGLTFSGARDL